MQDQRRTTDLLPRTFATATTAATFIALATSGCGEPSSPDIPSVESFGTGGSDGTATSGADGPQSADEGLDDTGTDDTGTQNSPDAGQCLIEEIVGLTGERYQCRGSFIAQFGADGVDENSFAVSFGHPTSEDSYDKPFVNACCGPIVEAPQCPNGDVNEHIWACYVDAAQQICVGIGTKVEEIRANVPAAQAFIKPSLADLSEWLNQASSIAECQNVFIQNTGLASFDCATNYSSLIEDTTWVFSDQKHGLIENPYLRIDYLEIDDAFKPEDGGESCINLHDNDGYIPLEVGPDEPGWTSMVLTGGMVTLRGPELDGSTVTGSARLASVATHCEGKGCSSLSADLEVGNDLWRLEGLRLHSVGAAIAGSESISVAVDEYTISLFSPAVGSRVGGTFAIPAGTAVFSLAGKTAFGNYSLATTNTSRIELQITPQGWVMSPFEIGYIDQNGQDWRLLIETMPWAQPPPT